MNCKELKLLRRELEFYKKNLDKYSDDERLQKLKSMKSRLDKIFLNPNLCSACQAEAKTLLVEFSLN